MDSTPPETPSPSGVQPTTGDQKVYESDNEAEILIGSPQGRPEPMRAVRYHRQPRGVKYPFSTTEFHLENSEEIIDKIMNGVVSPEEAEFFPLVNG